MTDVDPPPEPEPADLAEDEPALYRETELRSNLDRVMKEEKEEGDGSIDMASVNTDWTDFAYT